MINQHHRILAEFDILKKKIVTPDTSKIFKFLKNIYTCNFLFFFPQ